MPIAPGVSSAPQVPLPRAQGARSSLALRAAVVLAVSAAAAAAVGTLTSGSTPPATLRAPAPRPEIHAIQAAQSASFGVLRRPQHPRDLFATLHAGSGPLGANPSLARSVAMPAGALAPRLLSVVPANGSICLRLLFSSGVVYWECRTTGQAVEGELIAGLRRAGARAGRRPVPPPRSSSQFIVGLVPDGVRAVTITAARGVSRTLAVGANVYAATIFAPRTISFVLPGRGARSYPAP